MELRRLCFSVWFPQSDIARGIIECASDRLWAKGPDMYSQNYPWGCELKLLRKTKRKKTCSFDTVLSERKQQTYSYTWHEFKVLLEVWWTGDIVGCTYIIFLYPGGNASGAAHWDLAYLEQCAYDLFSNGILIDTVGADVTLHLPHRWCRQTASKNKVKPFPPPFLR